MNSFTKPVSSSSKLLLCPRWPSIFVLYLFYKFHGTFSQLKLKSIARQSSQLGSSQLHSYEISQVLSGPILLSPRTY